MKNPISIRTASLLLAMHISPVCLAEVVDSASDGFSLAISRETKLDAKNAFERLVADFSKWYDVSHSYSGKAENLKIDLKRQCMLEDLPEGGFVRHMEVVFYQPSTQTLRLSGGLGPLQGMGVSGAMTFQIAKTEAGSKVNLTYTVCGYSKQNLDKLAPIVDQVLTSQVTALQRYCDEQTGASGADKLE